MSDAVDQMRPTALREFGRHQREKQGKKTDEESMYWKISPLQLLRSVSAIDSESNDNIQFSLTQQSGYYFTS
ncbi:uncharacterized protein V6R79_024452 [Siganus canaliculatus]